MGMFSPSPGRLAVCCEASYYLLYLISQLSQSGIVHGLSYMAELASGNSSQSQSQECALNLLVDQTLHKNFYSSDYWSCRPWLALPQRCENWLGTILGEFLIRMLSASKEGKKSSCVLHIFSEGKKKKEWSRLFLEEEYSSQNKSQAGGVCIGSKKVFFSGCVDVLHHLGEPIQSI